MEKDQIEKRFLEEKREITQKLFEENNKIKALLQKEIDDNKQVNTLKDKQIKLLTNKLKIAAAELIKRDQLI